MNLRERSHLFMSPNKHGCSKISACKGDKKPKVGAELRTNTKEDPHCWVRAGKQGQEETRKESAAMY